MDDKLPHNKLSDAILASRWMTLATNGTAIAFCSIAAVLNYKVGNIELFGLMCLLIGMSATISLYSCVTPGLFRIYGEAESAVMRAQLEKDMSAAMADFAKQHPELEISRTQRVQ